VDVTAVGTVGRARIQHPAQAGQFDLGMHGAIASAHFAAGES
jgi:hypothetical protein